MTDNRCLTQTGLSTTTKAEIYELEESFERRGGICELCSHACLFYQETKYLSQNPPNSCRLTSHWADMGHTDTLGDKESENTSIRLLSSASLVRGSKGEGGKDWLLDDQPTVSAFLPHRVFVETWVG